MTKRLFAAVLVVLIQPATAEFLTNDSPLVSDNTYLDLARAGERVVAVGDRGAIIYSDDQDEQWQPASVPAKVLLTAVCFADAQHGWAVGHDAVVLGTDDGGETWQQEYSNVLGADDTGTDPAESSASDDSDYSMDDLYGDAGGSDGLGGGFDAGPVDTAGAPLLDVHCESAQRAVAVGGYGYYLETRDGGESWQKGHERLNNAEGWHLYSLTAVPGTRERYLAGERGVLFYSDDAGENWTALESPYGGTFFGVSALSRHHVLVYGLQGNVWLSKDSGVDWMPLPTRLSRGINDAAVLHNGTWVLVSNAGGILTSHDNGTSLTLRFLPERESIAAVLPRARGGVYLAGRGGVRVHNEIRQEGR